MSRLHQVIRTTSSSSYYVVFRQGDLRRSRFVQRTIRISPLILVSIFFTSDPLPTPVRCVQFQSGTDPLRLSTVLSFSAVFRVIIFHQFVSEFPLRLSVVSSLCVALDYAHPNVTVIPPPILHIYSISSSPPLSMI